MAIAITGLSCRFSGAEDEHEFWQLLRDGRSGWSEVPADRWRSDSFWHPSAERNGTTNHRGGHFLAGDISKFDASFFGIAPNEANAMDPQQRLVLQGVFEALENAGMPLDVVAGSDTAVFAAIFSRDYLAMSNKDTQHISNYYFTGVGDAILANRVSYLFDLHGPSITLDTGCSGSLVAVHMACQSLLANEATAAIVSGVNLMLHPDQQIPMSLAHFLNDDGKCYTFDSRGAGYGRGEGVGTVVLKRLDDALRDGDPIRAVIRGSGVNQDGKTQGITLPSREAQERLARSVYSRADLDPSRTAYVEAHGTGTVAGDLAEVHGIRNVFGPGVKIGSVKPNIGHTESASGIAGLIKSVLMLEHQSIPPQANLEQLKEGLPFDVQISRELKPLPGGQISVSSFGYGGTNAHLIVEASGTSHVRSLHVEECGNGVESADAVPCGANGHYVGTADDPEPHCSAKYPVYTRRYHLLTLSARNEQSLTEYVARMAEWATQQDNIQPRLRDLEYTLHYRRSQFPWRSTLAVSSHSELLLSIEADSLRPLKISSDVRIVYLFPGQGAQWYAMGRELLTSSPVFAASINRSTRILESLGSSWSLLEELRRDEQYSRVNKSEIGQPASTAVQIALVDYLAFLSIRPTAVIGHSSGEIAGAYAAGALDHETALAISYHRSFLSALSKQKLGRSGAMAAIGMSEEELQPELSRLRSGSAKVACLNHSTSTTVSGDDAAIDELLANLGSSVSSRKLNVDCAYHSDHMLVVAETYLSAMEGLPDQPKQPEIDFISSVTGAKKADGFSPAYWVDNLISTVRFTDAVQSFCQQQSISGKATSCAFLEVGPHRVLSGPARRVVSECNAQSSRWTFLSTLIHGHDAERSMIDSTGKLWQLGFQVNLQPIIETSEHQRPAALTDLPLYAWDYSKSYWRESRLSRDHRFRESPPHDLLGVRLIDGDPAEPTWRNILTLDAIPWLRDHNIDGQVVYPASGYITMAIEALGQIHGQMKLPEMNRFRLRDTRFLNMMQIPESPESVEVYLHLRREGTGGDRSSSGWYSFRVTSFDGSSWHVHALGSICVEYHAGSDTLRENALDSSAIVRGSERVASSCTASMDATEVYRDLQARGNRYGATFAILTGLKASQSAIAGIAVIPDTAASIPAYHESKYLIHPATLDSLLQLSLPLFFRNGGNGSVVPTEVQEMSVMADLAKTSGNQLHCVGQLRYVDPRNATFQTCALQSSSEGEMTPVVHILGGELRSIGDAENGTSASSSKQTTHYMTFGQDPRFVTQQDLIATDANADAVLLATSREALLNELASYLICRCVATVQGQGLSVPNTYLEHYYAWMQRLAKTKPARQLFERWSQSLDSEPDLDFQSKLRQASDLDGLDRDVLTRLDHSLVPIVAGQVEPLSVFMEDGLYDRIYDADDAHLRCAQALAKYIKRVYHQYGPLSVLEVGGGTGATSKVLIEQLVCGDIQPFRRYTFTDVSPGFLERAKVTLAHHDFMQYGTLDITKEPANQSFSGGQYDVIIAANVVHATSPLDRSLRHLCKLLKPRGSLALIEVTRMTPAYNLMFGTFPGWWAGVADGRVDTPLMSTETWSQVLSKSGLDTLLSVADTDGPSPSTHLIVSQPQDLQLSSKAQFVSTSMDEASKALAVSFSEALRGGGAATSFSQIESDLDTVHVIIDTDKQPLLYQPTAAGLNPILTLVTRSQKVFWISADRHFREARGYRSSLVTGFARTARSEYPGLNLVTVDVGHLVCGISHDVSSHLVRIYKDSFCSARDLEVQDYEYVLENGSVLTPRIMPSTKLNKICDFGDEATAGESSEVRFRDSTRPLKLQVKKYGLLDSMVFVDDLSVREPLAPDQIEIEISACGVNFKDVFIALGQLKSTSTMVGECAGVVAAVGNELQDQFNIGDRVCASMGTPYASRCRISGSGASHIPDNMTLEEAAASLVVFATAHYGLVHVARISAGQKVLIHAASGGVGQAAIVIAQSVGAEIFATIGSDAKRKLLTQAYGIPDDHIFSSRERAFKDGIMRMTNGKGIDVVLNSLSGEALQDSFACLAPLGTFVEVGKSDIYQKSSIGMQHWDRNVTFASVDLVVIFHERPSLMKQILDEVMTCFRAGQYKPVTPITTMPMRDIEQAFRLIQSRKHTGKLVLTATPNDLVVADTPLRQPLVLGPGTYIIAGGLGEIGRQIAKYMARYGAAHIVLLTRRTLEGEEIDLALKDFEGLDATIIAKTCDITDAEDVRKLATDCAASLPPVKGIVQATVVLRDRILETMTAEDWTAALGPKVDGTNNLLDTFLPRSPDFVILLSSCASIAGTRGSSNYNAANAYMDSVAQASAPDGPFIAAVDVGMIPETKIVNKPEIIESLLRQGVVIISYEQLLNVCGYIMSGEAKQDGFRQITMGIHRESLAKQDDLFTLKSSLFNHLPHEEEPGARVTTQGKKTVGDVFAALKAASGREEQCHLASEAILVKMSALVASDELTVDTDLVEVGVDSLIAIELKSWLSRTFKASVQTKDILGAVSVWQLALKVLETSEAVPRT